MKYEIKHRFSGKVLFSGKYASLKLCVEAAVSLGANLGVANLGGANLRGANLWGAKYGDYEISKPPVQIAGLRYLVTILDHHMLIGCEHHGHDEWTKFTNKRILEMDGKAAGDFWREHKKMLLALCASHAPEEKRKAA